MEDVIFVLVYYFFFQAEDGIRDLVRSRGLGDVYKRQVPDDIPRFNDQYWGYTQRNLRAATFVRQTPGLYSCLLYTSDAADDLLCVDLGGRRIIKKKTYTDSLCPHYLLTILHNSNYLRLLFLPIVFILLFSSKHH